MRSPLTKTQQQVYQFLIDFIKENHYPPTIREIQNKFEYSSSNSVISHLKKLELKGYIIRSDSKSGTKVRTLRLVDNIIGVHTVKTDEISAALNTLSKRGYNIKLNEAIEFLTELKIVIA